MVRVLWLQCKTRVSAELVRALLMLFFDWNVAQHVQRAGRKMIMSEYEAHWLTGFPVGCTSGNNYGYHFFKS